MPSGMKHGGFSAKFFTRLGLADGAAIPEAMRPHIAAGIQRAMEATVICHGRLAARTSASRAAWG